MIEGGYYIKARAISNSDVSFASPCTREVWDWLLKEANYADKTYNGYTIKRGQLFRSIDDIREGLKWKIGFRTMRYSIDSTKHSMKWLRNHLMITTTKTIRGNLISICNYNKYQNPKSYEDPSEDPGEDPTKTPRTLRPLTRKKEEEEGKEEKKKNKKTTLDVAIDNFSDHRRKIKKPATEHALRLVRKKALKLAGGDESEAVKLIDNAIESGWQGVYEIQKTFTRAKNSPYGRQEMTREHMIHTLSMDLD